MGVDKHSREYLIVCRFFKEIGLYREFLEYQRDAMITRKGYNMPVPFNTVNPVKDLGNTVITNWMAVKKGIKPYRNFIHSFKAWLRAFYPQKFDQWCPYDSIFEDSCSINIKRKKITINNRK